MSTETTALADELRQVARNLDRAAGISAQYCVSEHHTAAIRRAADELERLREERDEYGNIAASALEALSDRGVLLASAEAKRIRAAFAAPPDPDQHHVDEIRRIMAAERPGGGA